MESLNIILDLESKGFREGTYGVIEYDGPITVGVMPNGTANGHPTVMIAVDAEDGESLMVMETTLALFLTAADAFKVKYGDPRRIIE